MVINTYRVEYIFKTKDGFADMDEIQIRTDKDLFQIPNLKQLEKRFANVKKVKSIAITNIELITQ